MQREYEGDLPKWWLIPTALDREQIYSDNFESPTTTSNMFKE